MKIGIHIGHAETESSNVSTIKNITIPEKSAHINDTALVCLKS